MASFNKKNDNMNALVNSFALPVDERRLVLKGLSNPAYLWRSAEGIAAEVDLPIESVKAALQYMSDSVIRSIVPDEEGRPLYTTPEHYRTHAGILRRALSALSDQVR
jgi:hypothetical protein